MPVPPFLHNQPHEDENLFSLGRMNLLPTTHKRRADSENKNKKQRARVERVTIERCASGLDNDSDKNNEINLSSVKWDELKVNTHSPYVVSGCWACSNSDHGKNREQYPSVAGLFDLFYNEYHCRDLDELCNLVHQYHESEIRQKQLKRGIECEAFTADKVREHFLRHALNPSIEIGEQLRQLQTLEKLLRDNVSKRNEESKEIIPDYKAIDLLLKIQKQTQSTLLLNTKLMNFYDPQTSVIK
jgi:hypothetical protein